MLKKETLSEQPANPDPSEIAKAFSSLGASKGGKARAQSLSPERRREIARKAIETRWAKQGRAPIPRATHEGPLTIGKMVIDCAVLQDGTRVLSERAFSRALNIVRGGYQYRQREKIADAGGELPIYLAIKDLIPFIDTELRVAVANPTNYITKTSGTPASGIDAKLIPAVCNVWLRARDAGVLSPRQLVTAAGADILMRGLATVGIIALVDEATGFQDDRARDALAKILEAFVAKELQPYVKIFPVDYFKELYRLKRLNWPPKGNKMPRYFGVITNDVVYSRLAPGLLRRLNEKNPKVGEKGYRKNKNTQWLTDDIGRPKLLEHLAITTAFMKVCDDGDYEGFHKLLDKARPKQIEAPLFDQLEKKESPDPA